VGGAEGGASGPSDGVPRRTVRHVEEVARLTAGVDDRLTFTVWLLEAREEAFE
jgi:hypothetical protein